MKNLVLSLLLLATPTFAFSATVDSYNPATKVSTRADVKAANTAGATDKALVVVDPVAAVAAVNLTNGTQKTQVVDTTGLIPADIGKPGGAGDTGSVRVAPKVALIYDSGIVASGGAIDSTVLSIPYGSIITMFVVKADSTSRAPTVTYYMDDGTTALYGPANTACASTGCMYNFGLTASGGTQAVALALSPKIRFQLAAGSSVNGRLVVYLR